MFVFASTVACEINVVVISPIWFTVKTLVYRQLDKIVAIGIQDEEVEVFFRILYALEHEASAVWAVTWSPYISHAYVCELCEVCTVRIDSEETCGFQVACEFHECDLSSVWRECRCHS